MVNTNICTYSFDGDEPAKQKTAQTLIADLIARGEFTLSTQVLAEFYNSATSRKRGKTILSEEDARTAVAYFAETATVYPVTETVILSAMGAMEQYKVALWDAIIWATAKENGETIISPRTFLALSAARLTASLTPIRSCRPHRSQRSHQRLPRPDAPRASERISACRADCRPGRAAHPAGALLA